MSFLALGCPAPPNAGWAHRRKTAKLALGSMLGACLLLWTGADAALAGSYLARCPIAAGTLGDRLTVTATEPVETGCVSLALPVQADSVRRERDTSANTRRKPPNPVQQVAWHTHKYSMALVGTQIYCPHELSAI